MMKRMMIALLCLLLLLTGCGREDPYRVDTVVRIPVNPTEETRPPETEPEATPPVTELAEPTETEPEETELPTEPATEPTEAKKPSGGGSGGRKPSSDKGNSSGQKPNPTEPPRTEPAEEGAEPSQTEIAPTDTHETAVPETEPQIYDISGYSPGSLEYAVADALNAAREAEGLSALTMDTRLSAIASCRAWEISQVWSHTRPDGRHYTTVLGDYGYAASSVTELLLYHSGGNDGAAIAARWMESESHRTAILSGYRLAGIGIYRAGGTVYVCCLLVG